MVVFLIKLLPFENSYLFIDRLNSVRSGALRFDQWEAREQNKYK